MKLVASAVLVVAALAGATLYRASALEARAERENPPEGRVFDVDGVPVHAVVSGEGPDLVLIHGASASTRDFTFGLMPELATRYRVIALDRPGHGWTGTTPETNSIHAQARLLRAAAAQLGAERPILLGHSYGGAVALAWGVDAPDKVAALVLVGAPSHRWDTGLPLFYRVTSNPVLGPIIRPLITAWVPDSVVTDALVEVFDPQEPPEGYMEHFGPRMSLRRVTLRENARQRAILKQELTALMAEYRKLRVPVESVHGEADSTVSISIHAEALIEDTETARLTRLPGIGHTPHQVARDAVVSAIDRAAGRAGLRPGTQ